MRSWRVAALAVGVLSSGALSGSRASAQQSASSGDWVAYGHDALGSRYAPLTQITRENVSRLAVA